MPSSGRIVREYLAVDGCVGALPVAVVAVTVAVSDTADLPPQWQGVITTLSIRRSIPPAWPVRRNPNPHVSVTITGGPRQRRFGEDQSRFHPHA